MQNVITYAIFVAGVAAIFAFLGWKWDFRRSVVARWIGWMVLAGGAAIAGLHAVWPAMPAWLLIVLGLVVAYGTTVATMLFLFFRDPERAIPGDPRVLVSPADGRVIYVKEVSDGAFPLAVKHGHVIPIEAFTSVSFPHQAFVHIGIEMTYLDVHVNRAPIAGTVERLVRVAGRFGSLRRTEALLENERVYTLLTGEGIRVGLLQIASRMVRRIVPYVAEGAVVQRGDRIGAIRFGSQVDMLIPDQPGLEILIRPGDLVRAGETPVARY